MFNMTYSFYGIKSSWRAMLLFLNKLFIFCNRDVLAKTEGSEGTQPLGPKLTIPIWYSKPSIVVVSWPRNMKYQLNIQ